MAAPSSDNVAHALAGAGGGILSMLLTYPLVTLSTRAQVESRRAHAPFIATVRRIIAREGVPGLYAGLTSALLGISLTNFVYYYWYEWTRAALRRGAAAGGSGRGISTLLRGAAREAVCAGAVAGAATVVVTNPIWVVNTRLTTGRGPVTGAGGGGVFATLLAMLRTEGLPALFAGVRPALILVSNPILQYALFEQLRALVLRRRSAFSPALAFLLGAVSKLVATVVTYPYLTVKSQMHVAGSTNNTHHDEKPAPVPPSEGIVAALRRIVAESGYAGLYHGIGPKILQSVLTAAFLFAFKDVLYEQTVRLRLAAAARRRLVAKK